MNACAVLRERGKLGSQFDCTAVSCEMRAERAFKVRLPKAFRVVLAYELASFLTVVGRINVRMEWQVWAPYKGKR